MANWQVTAASGLPLNKSTSWDGQTARDEIFAWAKNDSDAGFDSAKARKGFCFMDGDSPDAKGSYKDAFCRVIDGTLKADKKGVDACARRIQDTDGPSADQKNEAMNRMEDYQDKFGEGGPDDDTDSDDSGRLFLPARARAMAPDPEKAITVRDLAPDPTIFDETPPFLWTAEISNGSHDFYDTRMHDSTLRNYAEDAKAGMSFQNSHEVYDLPFGRSFDGHYYDGRSAGGKRTEADFYTIPDLTLNGVNTNDLIRGMRSGVVRDVSIGFYGGYIRCAACDKEFRGDFEGCDHIVSFMGRVYSLAADEEGQPVVGWIHDAHARETSAVYKGATPGAQIKQAQYRLQEMLPPDSVRFLEKRHHVRLWEPKPRVIPVSAGHRDVPAGDPVYGSGDSGSSPHGASGREPYTGSHMHDHTDGKGGKHMHLHDHQGDANHSSHVHDSTEEPVDTDEGRAVSAVSASASLLSVAGPSFETVRAVIGEAGGDMTLDWEAAVREMGATIRRLTPLADEGRQYRADLIEQALTEGVRAHGDGFAIETYRGVLERSEIGVVKQMRDDWTRAADAYFRGNSKDLAGGRLTTAGANGRVSKGRAVPDAAYKG